MTSEPGNQQANRRGIDRDRFVQLLEPCMKRLDDFAHAMARDPDEARDLVAETILRAYEGFAALRDHKAFLGYLFAIASREHRRRKQRARLFGTFNAEQAERIRFAGTMPDAAADVQLLYAALALLPAKQREAVVLFEISGLSLKEICEIQGGTVTGVKVRVHRARRRLAVLLGVEAGPAFTPGANGDRRAGTDAAPTNPDSALWIDLDITDQHPNGRLA